MQYPLLVISVLCLGFACQSNRVPGRIGQALGPEKQQFSIAVGRDTVIRCKSGMVLRFCPNTFICAENKFVLEVQEVRDRGEAFLLGISTLASDGRLLETEGMIYLNAITAAGSVVSINPDCPIRLEIPVRGRRAGVKWFKGNETGQDISWDEIERGISNQIDISNLATGQQLFKNLCASCHCPDMNSFLTGPALGNITQFREKAWLHRFTRNSQSLIASGDSMAVCSWEKFKPAVMPDFSKLSDLQIETIYQFIEEESARLNIRIDSAYYACSPATKTLDETKVHAEDSGVDIVSLPLFYFGKRPNAYFAKIYSLGWHNCDLFVDDTSAIPAVIKISIPNPEQYDELLAGILFDELNANIELNDYGNGQFETVREWAVRFPQAPARIVVIGIRGKRWSLYEQPFMIGTNNVFTATMEAISSKKMNEFIRTRAFKQPELEAALLQCPLQSQ